MCRRLSIVLVVVFGCESSSTTTATDPTGTPTMVKTKAAIKSATDFAFDGFKLGDKFGAVMMRAPYTDPSDDDPIDRAKTERMMFYSGKSFPAETTVVFLVEYAPDDDYDQPINSFGWFGGDYFRDKSDFPVHPGDDASASRRVFGAVEKTMAIESKGVKLTVERYAGDVHVVIDGDKIAGFLLGKVRFDPQDPRWRAIAQVYRRHAKRVATEGSNGRTKAECEALADHVLSLMAKDPEMASDMAKYRASRARKVGQCMDDRHLTAEKAACARKATSMSELKACM